MPSQVQPLSSAGHDRVMQIGNLEIRPAEFQVLAGGRRVGLTLREFEVFMVLVERADRVVPRPQIFELVWGGAMAYRDRSVDVFVRKVRGKLEVCSPGWVYVHTHFGIGYRFSPERRADASEVSEISDNGGRPDRRER